MKILVQIARVLTGLLFIFSGMVKLNDPSGFSIKLNEYFDVFAQDVATKQDTLKVSLLQGVNVLGSKQYVLYSFDESKDLAVRTEHAPRTDTAGNILGFDAAIEVSLASQQVARMDFPLQDSTAVALYSVKAEVAGKSAFQKTYPVTVLKPVAETHALNLKEYVKEESFLNGFFKGLKDFSLWLSIFVCALEVILGFALLVGWKSRLTAWLLLLLILYFTFLTFYAAYFNKVTDCGCFGDFIKLKPWQSFNKDLILTVLILIIFVGTRYIKPWFSKTFGWKFMGGVTILTLGFGIFCYLYLPVWDFLPYKKGNNIHRIMTEVPAGMRATDSIELVYTMHKGNDSVDVPFISPYTEYTKRVKEGWIAGKRTDKVIIEGWESAIHDFAINDAATGADRKDSLLLGKGFQLVLILPMLEGTYEGALPEIREIWKWSDDKNIPFFPLTATSPAPAAEFSAKHKLDFTFFSSDQKMLLTMARYNPTLYLFNGPVVVDKWSGRNLPSVKKLEKLISR